MNILIAVDGSPHSQITLQLGRKIARLTDSPATVLTVARRKSARQECNQYLEKVSQLMSNEAVKIDTKIRTGNPVREIVREAKERNFDLLIIGSRPVNERLKRIFGATADQVIARAPCPVLISKQDVGDVRHILICDSGAEGPTLMKRCTRQISELVKKGTQVSVLHVMSQMSAGPGVRGWQLRAEAEEMIGAHTPEGEILEDDIHELETVDVDPRVIIRHGWVVDEIISEAKQGNYGLIVIGAHLSKGWQRFLLDDLADQIIAQSDRPVLVIK